MLNVGHANEAGEESWIGDEVSKIYVIETLPTLSSAPQCQAFNTLYIVQKSYVDFCGTSAVFSNLNI